MWEYLIITYTSINPFVLLGLRSNSDKVLVYHSTYSEKVKHGARIPDTTPQWSLQDWAHNTHDPLC